MFLYDTDTNKKVEEENSYVIMVMPFFPEHKMEKGIENALVLDEMNLNEFYEEHVHKREYGQLTTLKDFCKMKLCDYICGLDCEMQMRILANLKPVIENIIEHVKRHEKRNEC